VYTTKDGGQCGPEYAARDAFSSTILFGFAGEIGPMLAACRVEMPPPSSSPKIVDGSRGVA
jgi:hypothetical protein